MKMIEITYSDMFLIAIIVVLLVQWVRSCVELVALKREMLQGLFALYEGEAEIIVDERERSIRLQSKEKKA
jgi:ABC-type enterochelin transport system permease subunit